MEFILIALSALYLLFCVKSKIYRKSILTVFCMMWTVIFAFYSLRLYGLYNCKDRTFLMYIVGVTSFFVGYILIRPSKRITVEQLHTPNKVLSKWRNFVIVVVSIVSIVVLARKSMLAIPLWMAGGAGEVKRGILRDDALNVGGIQEIIYTFIARPIQIIMVIYAVIVILASLRQKYIVWLAILLTIAGFICSGSKSAIAEIATMVFAYVFLFSKMTFRNFFYKYKKLSLVTLIAIVFIGFLLSLKEDGLFLELYTYICGCMPCSDEALTKLYEENHYYGLASFNGILRAINLVPRYLGIGPDFKIILDLVWTEMMNFEDTMYIADSIKYNAFVSMFIYFFADGGYWGVAIMSFLFGISCSYALRIALQKPNVYSCSLVLYLVVIISLSMIRFQFFYAPYAMALIYLIILFPRIPLNNISVGMSNIKTRRVFRQKLEAKQARIDVAQSN